MMHRLSRSTIYGPVNSRGLFAKSLSQQHNTKSEKRTNTNPSIDPEKEECDCIGPADPHSNLRVVKYYVPPDETPLERKYRISRIQTQEWNQQFWEDHNYKFKEGKREFITEKLKEKYGDDKEMRKTLSADEMSEFYKKFLDNHRLIHKQYNKDWYIRNINNVILAARVWLEQTVKTRR